MISTFLKREFRLEQFGINHNRPSEFTRCQWQRADSGISIPYLVYRWLLAGYLLGSMLACISEPRDDISFTLKWPIYLTNWGYLVQTLQALIAAYLVTSQLRRERAKDYEVAPKESQMPALYKLYWVLHTSSIVLAFGITISYWAVVYDPRIHSLSAFNLMAHAVNSVMVAVDFCLVAHPFRLLHFYWPVLAVAGYLAFSAAYYALGGTDRHQRPFIYPLLNWEHGARTMAVVAGGLVFVFAVHCVVWSLYLVRSGPCCAGRRHRRHRHADRDPAKKGFDNSVSCSNSSMQLEVV